MDVDQHGRRISEGILLDNPLTLRLGRKYARVIPERPQAWHTLRSPITYLFYKEASMAMRDTVKGKIGS